MQLLEQAALQLDIPTPDHEQVIPTKGLLKVMAA
eukprot:CAMPEP_0181235054 /NCGR_PEP_ID=MMETSP1096-20121128/37346_1 /TAXON_ID=156174 ORGANISM="Chrysochromulina ericina, Strain CCMP281" /NCGR_SAMPLE_ID=MMETSP1096 /ASSEMBLY_ACC=CAM_ASM_000453 /LENGTH=33 /DNA_ID= /DNA_START= /DNA_END= /DNA_ORIENTATION=